MPDAPIKNDSEKPRMGLLPPDVLTLAAQVFTFGARKYAAWNWTKGFEWSRLYDAAQRHLNAWNAGEDNDPESGLPHLGHALCCVMMLSASALRKIGTDDRHKIAGVHWWYQATLDARAHPDDPPKRYAVGVDVGRDGGGVAVIVSQQGEQRTIEAIQDLPPPTLDSAKLKEDAAFACDSFRRAAFRTTCICGFPLEVHKVASAPEDAGWRLCQPSGIHYPHLWHERGQSWPTLKAGVHIVKNEPCPNHKNKTAK